MSTYRERRESKAERLRDWAEKREAKAAAAFGTAEQIGGMIPLGQPVLLGHHSQKRHMRDRDRIDRNMSAGVENGRKAREFRSRADNIEAAADQAIYSDDPDAVDRLREKLADLEAKRDRIKAYNATCRKGSTPDVSVLTDDERLKLADCLKFAGFQCKNGRFPSYMLSNLGGTINATRKRLAAMS